MFDALQRSSLLLSCCKQALALKFRFFSIRLTSEAFETDRKMSDMAMFQQLPKNALFHRPLRPHQCGSLKLTRS